MGVIWGLLVTSVTLLEVNHPGTAFQAAGASMEGKETRLGEWASALFAVSTTGTSTGSVNSFHDSFTSLGGGALIFNMGLGEVAPGGVGSGLYGMLVLAIMTVFVAGLMVGRTPEYLRKKITAPRDQAGLALHPDHAADRADRHRHRDVVRDTRASMLNSGPHGLAEVLYAFTSAANNNGSAFAGLSVNTPFYNIALGFAMLLGRFLPIIFVLALAGSLARQQQVPKTEGTLPTHGPLFVGMLTGVVIIVAGLTFFPVLALGPLAEGL